MPRDRWGEPIDVPPRTFSLASLLTFVTLAALLLGWLNWVKTNPFVAAWCYVGLALLLGAIVACRQPGGPGMKLSAGVGFGLFAILVGTYVFGWALVLVHGPWAAVTVLDPNPLRLSRPPGWSPVDSFFVCFLGVLGAPIVALCAWILAVAWTRLAEGRPFARPITSGGYESPRPH